MTVADLAKKLSLQAVSACEEEREITGVYVGDLLSWVMGRAESGNVWITIMSNVNVLAVATLADVACVILAEGVALDDDALVKSQREGINVLSSNESAYEICARLSTLL